MLYNKVNQLYVHIYLLPLGPLCPFTDEWVKKMGHTYRQWDIQFSRSVVSDSATPWTATRQASLFITNSQSSLKLMLIESVMPSNHLILCCPLLLMLSILSSIRVFSNESVLRIRWPKYRSFSFSISLCNEYSGLISFRIDWFGLLAVQGTLKSLLQHHSSNASILRVSCPLYLPLTFAVFYVCA